MSLLPAVVTLSVAWAVDVPSCGAQTEQVLGFGRRVPSDGVRQARVEHMDLGPSLTERRRERKRARSHRSSVLRSSDLVRLVTMVARWLGLRSWRADDLSQHRRSAPLHARRGVRCPVLKRVDVLPAKRSSTPTPPPSPPPSTPISRYTNARRLHTADRLFLSADIAVSSLLVSCSATSTDAACSLLFLLLLPSTVCRC